MEGFGGRFTSWSFPDLKCADALLSSAFMSCCQICLAAKYPCRIVDENKPPQKNFTSSTSKAMKGTQVSSAINLDCVEWIQWNEVTSATVTEISKAIQVRGMNNKLAQRIKSLDRIADERKSIDLEGLRDVPPDKAKRLQIILIISFLVRQCASKFTSSYRKVLQKDSKGPDCKYLYLLVL